jgi:hypothetical protein
MMRRSPMTAALIVALLLAAAVLVVWTQQRRLMYFPLGAVPPPADVGLAGTEAVRFTTADGLALQGWFVPARAGAGEAAHPGGGPHATVVVFNGNAGNRAYRAPLAAALRQNGYNVLRFD